MLGLCCRVITISYRPTTSHQAPPYPGNSLPQGKAKQGFGRLLSQCSQMPKLADSSIKAAKCPPANDRIKIADSSCPGLYVLDRRRHSSSHVDRWNRVQLVDEGDCCLATGTTEFLLTAGKDVPAGTMAMVSSTDFLRASETATAIATLNRQRHLTPSCGGFIPTAERTVGPARMIVGELDTQTRN